MAELIRLREKVMMKMLHELNLETSYDSLEKTKYNEQTNYLTI